MRKLLSVAIAVAMFAIFAIVPAQAQVPPGCPPPVPGQSYNCTVHLNNVTMGMPVSPIVCPDGSTVPGGFLTLTVATGVVHITINRAGDVWDTGTFEGGLVFLASTGVAYTGHFMQWFGDSINNQNAVSHFTATYVAIGSDGSHLTLHMDFHIGWSAVPSGPAEFVFFAKVTC
jgi:hypothetical protein